MTTFPLVQTGPHMTRQVLSEHPQIMIVAFRFEAPGASGALHEHPHVQATYVESGRFLFHVGERSFEVAQGDSFVVPAGVVHGCRCIAPGCLIDSFTPRRDDFL
ncbi:cupin domain-containing protein [Falsirhodobacter algicola]|uniref:Cupin domain-containing protein n=1 Tax=Falsirhodobacter algicola TaxID=2692330 RepID=A0A8J8MVM0_9RHOB|nr:cupin domain-containing protein [Falsirhodobacter algicola]QUS37236.1 cupin domain-containing protein [Falsirhodobacter algicola]